MRLATLTKIPPVVRLVHHVQVPLFRNGYALIFSAFATSALGVVYWVIAARLYPAEIVGVNSALLSVVFFLAQVAQLNLVSALNRFVPTAGRASARLIVTAYAVSSVIAVAVGVVFVAGIHIWSPTLAVLADNQLMAGWFVISIAVWVVFVLQDAALTGLRQATLVPVENTAFAVLKLLLLPVCAFLAPQVGVMASWTVATLLTVIPTNIVIFRQLIPRHARAEIRTVPVDWRGLSRFVLGDFVGSLAWVATITLLPLVVLEHEGAAVSAYFYLSWTIATSLYLVGLNMGMSMITEAAMNERKLDEYGYQALVQALRLVVPLVLALVALAGPFLNLFGQEYSQEATALFRLLILSAIPSVVVQLYMSVARVRRQVRRLVAWKLALSVLTLALTLVLIEMYGVTGVGLALLLSQGVIGLLMFCGELRPVWLPFLDIQRVNRWSRRMGIAPLLHRNERQTARHVVNHVLPQIASRAADVLANWNTQRILSATTDVVTVMVGRQGEPPAAVVKVSTTDSGAEALIKQSAVMRRLHADDRLGSWTHFVPVILADGVVDCRFFTVMSVLKGTDLRTLTRGQGSEAAQVAAIDAISKLHRQTAAGTFVDAGLVNLWVDGPIALLQRGYELRGSGDIRRQMDSLRARLSSAIAGTTLPVGWVHGDFGPQNVLVGGDGVTITGILDWDHASDKDLPILDVIHWLIWSRMLRQRRELGYVVRQLLDDSEWTPIERALLETAQAHLPGDEIEGGTLVLLSWLRHVSTAVRLSERLLAREWIWAGQNIEAVLRSI